MEIKLSDRYVRSIIKSHVGNVPISKEAVKVLKEYLDSEAHRVCECGLKEFISQNEFRKIPKRRLPGSIFKGVLNT